VSSNRENAKSKRNIELGNVVMLFLPASCNSYAPVLK
jgi:hypothetical protein